MALRRFPTPEWLPRAVKPVPLLLCLGIGTAAGADGVNTGYFGNVAIKGYDPVAYFTEGRPTKGLARVQLRLAWRHVAVLRTPGTGTPSRPNPFVTRRSMAASAPWERRTRKPRPTSIRKPGGSSAENSTCSADGKAWRRTSMPVPAT